MVVAEVPLWVTHNSNESKTTGASIGSSKSAQRAAHSIALLEGANKKKSAIYSVDVCGDIFATAGGDGAVRIWNINALFASKNKGGRYSEVDNQYHSTSTSSGRQSDESAEMSSDNNDNATTSLEKAASKTNVHDLSGAVVRRKKDNSTLPASPSKGGTFAKLPKTSALSSSDQHHQSKQNARLLCSLSAHSGSSILAVRFSNKGAYLASAGDDGSVCIYSTSDDNNKSQWHRVRLCRGHNLDAVGLAWSPDDSYLVSCSLDSEAPIIVWKTSDLDEQATSMIGHAYKILGKNVHTSMVKGIAFDPAGSYLCSSGDDPAICLWRAHDDWGLEAKVNDIFPQHTDDPSALAAQSLFRRISWAADGSFICSTNAVVKNKHVASTINRQGWKTAVSDGEGAAHLVGHKQPVVVSRGAPELVRHGSKNGQASTNVDSDIDESDDNDDYNVPEYATLMALGDKRGFLTIWSTRKQRPLFKLHCSESRCQITDLSWGKMGKDIILLVSMLDGQFLALKFEVPKELGRILTLEEKSRVFESKYGIQTSDRFGQQAFSSRGDSQLIENAFHFTLENGHGEDGAPNGDDNHDDDDMVDVVDSPEPAEEAPPVNVLNTSLVRSKDGKKRIQPVLMNVSKKAKPSPPPAAHVPKKAPPSVVDPMQAAMDAAKKAAEAAKGIQHQQGGAPGTPSRVGGSPKKPGTPSRKAQDRAVGESLAVELIPFAKKNLFSIDLPLIDEDALDVMEESNTVVVQCNNLRKVPVGSKMRAVPNIDITITRGGKTFWNDQIAGTSCTSLTASTQFFAIGTSDGCLQLYGTSGSLGWACRHAFRSHPPLILGYPVISVHLKETSDGEVTLLTLTGDGSFAVYSVTPVLRRLYGGSIRKAMTHMSLASDAADLVPNLHRIQLHSTGHVILLLSFLNESSNGQAGQQTTHRRGGNHVDAGVGGSVQAFVYDVNAELWLRVADSRFLLSDFYTILPSKTKAKGTLAYTDDAVKIGAAHSTLKPQRSRALDTDRILSHSLSDSGNVLPTRAHCEDRLACSVALKSRNEFKHWLTLYIRVLASSSNEDYLRILVDMIRQEEGVDEESDGSCWWLVRGPKILGLDRGELLKGVILSEMGKHRSLQRLTNELVTEVNM